MTNTLTSYGRRLKVLEQTEQVLALRRLHFQLQKAEIKLHRQGVGLEAVGVVAVSANIHIRRLQFRRLALDQRIVEFGSGVEALEGGQNDT